METSWAIKCANEIISSRKPIKQDIIYNNCLLLGSIYNLYLKTNDKKYFEFCNAYISGTIEASGDIKGFNPNFFDPNIVNNAKLFFEFYNLTEDERYKTAIYNIVNYLENYPKTRDGIFCRKLVSKNKNCHHDLYAGTVFLAKYLSDFREKPVFDEIIRQFIINFQHIKNVKSEVNSNLWGIVCGFFCMATVDVLDIISKNCFERKYLLDILRKSIDFIVQAQDESGCWFQVMNRGERKGNYLEATASCMFLYSLTQAYSKGYVKNNKYLAAMENAYLGIIDEFVLITNNNEITINKTCSVFSQDSDGSFTYYINKPILSNDLSGIGMFILAMTEYEHFKGKI